jgi:hypothetical protein
MAPTWKRCFLAQTLQHARVNFLYQLTSFTLKNRFQELKYAQGVMFGVMLQLVSRLAIYLQKYLNKHASLFRLQSTLRPRMHL